LNKITAYNIAKVSALNWSVDKLGYHKANIVVGGKRFGIQRHVLNFYKEFGWIPDMVDHEDGVPGNDEPSNLRAATRSQNSCNSKVRSNNTSGIKGVYYDKRRNKWRVRIGINGRKISGGVFLTIEEAELVADSLRKELHGDFARDK